MFPDLIDIGFLHLKTYGACMALGFILCWTLVERLSGRKDLAGLIVSQMASGVYIVATESGVNFKIVK